jgi:hypothetical protein
MKVSRLKTASNSARHPLGFTPRKKLRRPFGSVSAAKWVPYPFHLNDSAP